MGIEIFDFVNAQFSYFNILLTIPSSIVFSNIFLRIIKTIGPISSPPRPINLKPVYIAIKVNIGCIPILLLTILGSINCLVIRIIAYKIINPIPNLISPFSPEITAQGTITLPDPKYWHGIYKTNS